jgi:hypothetical protein
MGPTRRDAAGVKCIFPSAPGYQDELEDAIESLSKKGLDNCQVRGGPKTCVRVACSGESSIFLCNDVSHDLYSGLKSIGNILNAI